MVSMILETERLILDTWQNDDWSVLRPIATDVEVMRYITGGVAWSDERIRSFVDRQIDTYSTRGFCRWKLLEKPANNFVGFCGPGFWRDAEAPEIGWWLARSCWGRGLATEAAITALRDAFERVRLDRVISVAMPDNKASTRIMEKLGLTFDGEFESQGTRLVRYAMNREQYEARLSPPCKPHAASRKACGNGCDA
jgi:RimJ/RimL family protein N-acetyltransferase